MDINKAVTILVQAVELATQKGAYSLKEAKLIAEAVEFVTKKPEEPKEEVK